MTSRAAAVPAQLKTDHSNIKQELIALWTGVEGNDSIHEEDGIIGHGLTMDIAKGLFIHEHTC